MAIGSGDWGEALNAGIHHYYGLAYAQHKPQYTEIFEVLTSSKNKETSLSASGFGLVPEKAKGESVSYETADENWIHEIVHVTYGLGFAVEYELYEDEMYGIINKLPGSLARSVNQTIETTAAGILNNAFVTTYTTGGDGLELCSLLHLLGGGGTYQNEPTTDSDLDETSLEQAEIDINDIVDDKGLRMALKPKKLVVAAENRWNADKLLGTPAGYGTAYMDKNPASNYVPYTVNSWLTDPDAWFILTDAPHGLVFYWRRKPVFSRDNDFDSENSKWKTMMRFSVNWDDPRCIYGSKGA